jgi:hypothetical protein
MPGRTNHFSDDSRGGVMAILDGCAHQHVKDGAVVARADAARDKAWLRPQPAFISALAMKTSSIVNRQVVTSTASVIGSLLAYSGEPD